MKCTYIKNDNLKSYITKNIMTFNLYYICRIINFVKDSENGKYKNVCLKIFIKIIQQLIKYIYYYHKGVFKPIIMEHKSYKSYMEFNF